MKNVDVDIYVSQIVKFFESNPKELKILIGELDKQFFFNKIKERAYQNFENGDEISLTKKQMVEIVVELYNEKKNETPVAQGFTRTKYGDICMN